MTAHRVPARIFGLFFIFTFLSYGIGTGLIDSVITRQDFLSNVNVNQTQVAIGVVLMALVHTVFNIGMLVIMLPILKPYNVYLAYGYLISSVAATAILVVGAIFLLLLLPLSDEYVNASSVTIPTIEMIGELLKKGSFFGYHMGMALWSIGGMLFVAVLYTSKLIPRPMSVWGMIGYLVLLLGSISEMFRHNDIVEIVSVIPGGLFEITLSVWLIIKGFNGSAIGLELSKA